MVPDEDDLNELALGDDDEIESDAEEQGEGGDDGEGHAEGHERGQGEENEGDEGRQAGGVNRAERAPGRASNRLQTLRNENRQLAEQTARLQRDFEELRRQQAQPRAEDPGLEAQRLAVMMPEERIEYRFQQSEQRHAQQLRQIQRQTAESSDRSAFMALQASQPVAKRYADKVEQLFQQEFGKGNFVDRQTILNYVVGQAVLARGAQDGAKQRTQARQRVERQQTRPSNGRGDVQTGQRRGSSLADRLADVTI